MKNNLNKLTLENDPDSPEAQSAQSAGCVQAESDAFRFQFLINFLTIVLIALAILIPYSIKANSAKVPSLPPLSLADAEGEGTSTADADSTDDDSESGAAKLAGKGTDSNSSAGDKAVGVASLVDGNSSDSSDSDATGDASKKGASAMVAGKSSKKGSAKGSQKGSDSNSTDGDAATVAANKKGANPKSTDDAPPTGAASLVAGKGSDSDSTNPDESKPAESKPAGSDTAETSDKETMPLAGGAESESKPKDGLNYPRVPVDSSDIVSVGFNPESKKLFVEFKGGRIYQYADVPAEVHTRLMKAKSHGKYFDRKIKNADYKTKQLK